MDIMQSKKSKIIGTSKDSPYYPGEAASRIQSAANSERNPNSPLANEKPSDQLVREEDKSDSKKEAVEEEKTEEREQRKEVEEQPKALTIIKEKQAPTILAIGILICCWIVAGLTKNKLKI